MRSWLSSATERLLSTLAEMIADGASGVPLRVAMISNTLSTCPSNAFLFGRISTVFIELMGDISDYLASTTAFIKVAFFGSPIAALHALTNAALAD